MNDLIVIGAGGFAREVIWLAEDCGYNVLGVLDDFVAKKTQVGSYEVIGKVEDIDNYNYNYNYNDCDFVIAIGNPAIRKMVAHKLSRFSNISFAKLIHPTVILSDRVKIGEGSVICAGSILTVDISIGVHNILNLNVSVGHDCNFGDFVTIAPKVAISGNVQLDSCVEIGTGAIIRQGLSIGSGSMLGMGAVLTKDIGENLLYFGSPAKKIKEIS